eukprot:TRINITY_DN1003_c0_g1::TRINITY_DN1003_c0_g1_i1::g.29988::m.29988 TRINITY_DN1003_c0_g1::TRINITY_DN1003_c0_g1_i1::g.29988  ORF type:complete len:243 (-),score=69.97,sp/Q9VHD2/MAAI2_DROME/54.38/2e-78,GST_N_3/PF13417.1/1.3e-16,GST_N/PF02798.15/6e-13,GST_N/PF02798.15/4.5e+03,GST_N_2/PF13409.1/2.4e-10,GST_C/PF00043.20/2.2e-07,GST_C_2/PF13410.1/4.1e-05,GST_C_3/PF14497.1/9.3e-05,Glutaredoxin/PF00462.19/0.082,Glutaredoxin/PF00462.19/1.2e+04,Glutaredoxin/PF00462.19/2.3e+03 TRINITY_DN1003_c0_g1_i1:265-993(-
MGVTQGIELSEPMIRDVQIIEMASDKPVLYNYWRSSCSYRVRIALNLKGIEFEYVPVNLLKGEQHQQDYINSSNPSHEVPSLRIDGHTIAQSIAILEYIEETRPQVPLMPKDAAVRAKVRQISEIINSGIQPLMNLRVLKKAVADSGKPAEEAEAVKAAWVGYWLDYGMDALENALKQSAGKYCVGDHVTLADCCLMPQVFAARRFNCDISKYPTIARLEQTLSELPAFQAAHPSKQPDAVL